MSKKPTYAELEQRVQELENEAAERKLAENRIKESETLLRISTHHWILQILINC